MSGIIFFNFHIENFCRAPYKSAALFVWWSWCWFSTGKWDSDTLRLRVVRVTHYIYTHIIYIHAPQLSRATSLHFTHNKMCEYAAEGAAYMSVLMITVYL